MATQKQATVYIENNTGGNAWILLYHFNHSNGTQTGSWQAAPGQAVGPLTTYFESTGDALDWWSVLVHVKDGPTPGFYVSSGTDFVPYWKECQFRDSDAGKMMTFAVSATEFDVKLSSGTCTGRMTKLTRGAPITHVFVVMLENRSFDSMFAMSGIKGITAATTSNFNQYKSKMYFVQRGAPLALPTDPGHEFLDVVEQLCGEGAQWKPGGPYPPINNSGFVANYATTTDELTGLPPEADFGDVMACFDTRTQLPVLYQLATKFAICDQWHSSLPGLTWPNRFFLHGASSSGMDANPDTEQIVDWEFYGFRYPHGSIYDALSKAGIPYRFYNDNSGDNLVTLGRSLYSDHPEKGSAFGAVPQVTSLHGVHLDEVYSLKHFAAHLQNPYPYPYTFIEPHYGNVRDNTYEGGSSQHPMDNVYGGEHLLAAVYSAIRNSPYWNTSLLIITYDEHGGLFDIVHPHPKAATPPGDNPPPGYNVNGFKFDMYGVRVPGIVVSPLIPAGTVDHTLYDHTSVLKTLEDLFGVNPLTNRDAVAKSVLSLLSLKIPRTDCPTSLNTPAPSLMAATPSMTAEERARLDALPLPDSGNVVNALYTLKKAEVELSGKTPPEIAAIHARFATIQTRGDAEAYALEVLEKARVAHEQRELARLIPPP